MSRIDALIAELCPNGITFEPLSKVGKWYGGGTPSKSRLDYWRGGTVPWISPKDMGRHVVETTEDYITEAAIKGSATTLVPANSIAVVVRSSILDRIFPTALVPMSAALNQDMKAIVPRDDVLPSYLAHMMRSRGPEILRVARRTGGSVASIESSKLRSFRIPIPPLQVQREIVKVLDTFTKLEAELEAELEARRRQYKYYRDALLSFAEPTSKHTARWMMLSEVGQFIRGRRFTKADYADEGIDVIHYGEIYTHYGTSATSVLSRVRSDMQTTLRYAKPGDLVITDVGETVEDVGKAVAWLGAGEVAIHDHCYAFRHSMNPKFVSYCMQTTPFVAQKAKYVARTKVNTLLMEGFAKIKIPVPPLEEQARIVVILDQFDTLVNDLSIGLPAELKARRKQYAHYRDRLLSFREAA